MKTIVSITPLKVQEDSRTFKIAASFARFGYRSIVVEGAASDLNRSELPFELISIEANKTKANVSTAPNKSTSTAHGLLKQIYDRLPNFLKHLCLSLHYQADYIYYVFGLFYLQGIRPLRYIPRASLYYLHSSYEYPAVFIKCKRHLVPFVYDAHDFYQGMEILDNKTYYENLVDRILTPVERQCSKHAAAVVTVGDGIARLHKGLFNTAPVVIRNCHDYRLDRKPTVNLRQSLSLSSGDFLLVSVGQAKPGMGVEELLSAMQKLPANVHVALVGKNTNQYSEFIQSPELMGRVHLVPPVMPFEVVPFIESADAALIIYYSRAPNYYNCLPNGFFQAIGAGLPLLYPELPEIEKIAKQYNLGIPIDTRNPESIKDGVLQMISNTEKLSEYRGNALVARVELSWEREENILRELIYNILEKSNT